MTVTYTGNLKLGLPTTGTESGNWGNVVNDQITTLVDQSISGTVSLTSMTNADYTLTNGNGNAANEARYMALLVPSSLTLTAARNIIVPTSSKSYIVRNLSTGGFAVTVKTSGGSGISVPNGSTMLLYCDGPNVGLASDPAAAGTLAVANGGTGSTTLAANNVLLGNGTSALQAVAPSTSGNVLTSNGTTWSSAAPAAAPVTSVNGVTGAVVTTALGGIGSVLMAANTSTSTYYMPGSTAAGTSLVYASTYVSSLSANTLLVTNGTYGGSDYTFSNVSMSTIQRVTTSNVGYQSPLGVTALTGTWRALAYVGAASSFWDGTSNTSYNPAGLWVRVS